MGGWTFGGAHGEPFLMSHKIMHEDPKMNGVPRLDQPGPLFPLCGPSGTCKLARDATKKRTGLELRIQFIGVRCRRLPIRPGPWQQQNSRVRQTATLKHGIQYSRGEEECCSFEPCVFLDYPQAVPVRGARSTFFGNPLQDGSWGRGG